MTGRYIIFADDDADDLELITGSFRQLEHEIQVLQFKDGSEVLRFLEREDQPLPELIVLDINMPRMNGREVLAYLRRHPRYRFVPVVLYTTSTNAADIEFCRALDACWLHKPNSIIEIEQAAGVLADFCRQHVVHR